MEKLLTPQQELFLKYYTDPKSPLFSNAKQSALKAGYSEEYACTITSKDLDWLSDNVGQGKLVEKALKNLDKLLEQTDDIRVQADMTKFTLGRLANDFKDKKDITSDGKAITINIASEIAEKNNL